MQCLFHLLMRGRNHSLYTIRSTYLHHQHSIKARNFIRCGFTFMIKMQTMYKMSMMSASYQWNTPSQENPIKRAIEMQYTMTSRVRGRQSRWSTCEERQNNTYFKMGNSHQTAAWCLVTRLQLTFLLNTCFQTNSMSIISLAPPIKFLIKQNHLFGGT